MIEEGRRTIEYRPVRDLRPAKRNPKRHVPHHELVAALARFGVVEPQVHDGRTGRIISGNGRLEMYQQAESEGLDPPEGVIEQGGVWLVPVVVGWRSRNNAEADAALIAVNRLAERGGWRREELADMLDEIANSRRSLTGLGFQPDDLADLRASLEEKPTEPAAPGAGSGGTGIRAIVLDYPVAEYDRVARQLQSLRRSRGVDTNAVLVASLVRSAAEASGIRV